MTTRRRHLMKLLGAIAALGPVQGASAEPPPVPVETARTDDTGELSPAMRRELAAQAVFDAQPARRVLYTWTTAEQIEALRGGGALLVREVSATGARAAFDEAMDAHRDTIVGELLTQPGYTKRRFAWSSPWPTVMGADGESYGDHLVRIELASDAVIAIFDETASPALQGFVRADGTPMTQAEFEAEPNALTAVYHVSSGQTPVQTTMGTTQMVPYQPVPWREIVLVSEVGVESWSYGTARIGRQLTSDRALLESLHRSLEAHPDEADARDGDVRARAARELWSGDPIDTIGESFAAAQALPAIEAMRFDEAALAAMVERLDAVIAAQGEPIER